MVLLKTIFILLLVYYLFKIVLRLFGTKLFNYAAKKTEERFRGSFGQFGQQPPANSDEIGKTVVDEKSTSKNATSKKVGEYIDFEEID